MSAVAAVAESLARAQLAAGRSLRTTAAGQSMWPFLRDGQAVEILPLHGAPAVGDVALVVLGGRLVLHRVVRLGEGGVVITKGDAELGADPPVPRGDLLGRLAPKPWDRLIALASAGPAGGLALGLGVARRLASRLHRML